MDTVSFLGNNDRSDFGSLILFLFFYRGQEDRIEDGPIHITESLRI